MSDINPAGFLSEARKNKKGKFRLKNFSRKNKEKK
jgi:hypothetical protein